MPKTKISLHISSQNHQQAPQKLRILTPFCKKISVTLDKNGKNAPTQLALPAPEQAYGLAYNKHFAKAPYLFEKQFWSSASVSKVERLQLEYRLNQLTTCSMRSEYKHFPFPRCYTYDYTNVTFIEYSKYIIKLEFSMHIAAPAATDIKSKTQKQKQDHKVSCNF